MGEYNIAVRDYDFRCPECNEKISHRIFVFYAFLAKIVVQINF